MPRTGTGTQQDLRASLFHGCFYWGCVCYLLCWCWVLWGCGLCCPPGPRPLCIPVHPPLDVQKDGIVWHPGVFGSGTFVALWTSARCRWKGRDREYLPAPWRLSLPACPQLYGFFCYYKQCYENILMHKALCIFLLISLEHMNRSENILLVIKDYYKYVLF